VYEQAVYILNLIIKYARGNDNNNTVDSCYVESQGEQEKVRDIEFYQKIWKNIEK
jgi:hypothetical protein